jgi:hypothetical protein
MLSMPSTPQPDPDPVVEAYNKDIDRTLIRENLKLTVEQRFRKAMELQRFARRNAARRPQGSRFQADRYRRC